MTDPSLPAVEAEPRTAEQLAILIAGDGPVLPVTTSIATTLAKTLESQRVAGLGRPCSTCVHMIQPRRWSKRCGHPVVAAILYDPVSHATKVADVTCWDERNGCKAQHDETPCGPTGRLHEDCGLPLRLNRIAAWFRARRMNLRH